MFLALRELWFARNRFLLMGAVVALISILMVILSGLSSGLVNDGVSALRRTPIQAFAFAPDTKADSAFSRSVVTEEQAQAWRMQPDVQDAELFGNMIVNAKTRSGTPVDLTLFGIEPGSFLEPVSADGRGLHADTDIIVSSTFRDDGVAIGDTVILDRLGTELTVVGFTEDKRTFGHVDVAYLPLRTWQEVHAGAKIGETANASAYSEASVVAIRGRWWRVAGPRVGRCGGGNVRKDARGIFRLLTRVLRGNDDNVDDQGVSVRDFGPGGRCILQYLDGSARS